MEGMAIDFRPAGFSTPVPVPVTFKKDVTLDTTGSTTASPRTLALATAVDGEAWRVGGARDGYQGGHSVRSQIWSRKGIELRGNRNSSAAPSFVSGDTASDPGVSIINTQPGVRALIVQAAAAQSTEVFQVLTSASTNLFAVGQTGAGTFAGSLTVGGLTDVTQNVTARSGATSEVKIGNLGPASQAAIKFGNSGTDYIYLNAAGDLRTASSFVATGTITGAGIISTNNITSATSFQTAATDGNGFYRMAEQTVDPAASANIAKLFAKDNGAGKTQLCVIFGTGAVQVIATEP